MGDFSLQESCFISPRKRAENSEERNTGRGQEDEKKTLKRLRHRFAAGEKDFFLSSSSFFVEEGEASEGREEEDSNRQTQCHQVKLIIDDI